MRILVLGADGMLGHQLVSTLSQRHEIHGSLRRDRAAYVDIGRFLPPSIIYDVDATSSRAIFKLLREVKPDAVINAVGIVKQRDEAKEALASIEVNALLPHRLAEAGREVGARVVHLSTDCVFSGKLGLYKESDFPDASDLYGRSKLLGEISYPGAITLRTSIIGLELSRKMGLLEWFLAQRGLIKGFRKAIYSGFTTLEMARIIGFILERHPDASGLYHVSSRPIDKYTLLQGLNDRLSRGIEIVPDDDFVCDRSLDSSRFQSDFSYTPPSWDEMLDEQSVQIKERDGC